MSSAALDSPAARNASNDDVALPIEQSKAVLDESSPSMDDASLMSAPAQPESPSSARWTMDGTNSAEKYASVGDDVGAADIDIVDEEADLLSGSTSSSKPRAAVEALSMPPGMATAGATFSRRRHFCAAVAAAAAVLGLLGALSFTVQHPSPHSAAAAAFPGSSGSSSAAGPHSRTASRLVNLSDVHASALPNALTFVTIGDWGRQGGNGQLAVAAVLGEWASLTPGIAPWVVSVGDQFYPEGVSSAEDPQFETSWRGVYTHPWFDSTRWLMINGNHDYRGAYLPVNWDGDARWVMPARYYAQTWNLPPQPHPQQQQQTQLQRQTQQPTEAQNAAEAHARKSPSDTVASDRRLRRHLLDEAAAASANASASTGGNDGNSSNGSGTYVAQSAAVPAGSAGRPSWSAAAAAAAPADPAQASSSAESGREGQQQQQLSQQPEAHQSAALRDCVHVVFLDTIPLIAEYRRAPESPAMAANIRAAGEAREQVDWLKAQLAAGASCRASLVFGHVSWLAACVRFWDNLDTCR